MCEMESEKEGSKNSDKEIELTRRVGQRDSEGQRRHVTKIEGKRGRIGGKRRRSNETVVVCGRLNVYQEHLQYSIAEVRK